MQKEHSETNEKAWNFGPYEAWCARYGTPEQAAARIVQNPESRLKGLLEHMGEVKGRKVANLLGSHGSKSVALALFGAKPAVFDISAENARYASELAKAAGVELRYVVSDVLQLPEKELTGDYDLAFMELGIVHYFLDLVPLMEVVRKLLKPGGRLILQDFHPVTTKLISSRGTTANIRKHKVTGDYFDTSLKETEVAYGKFLPEEVRAEIPKARIRQWTLGEIVTAAAEAGLTVRKLLEEPNKSSEVFDAGIPKTFTLIAEKTGTSGI